MGKHMRFRGETRTEDPCGRAAVATARVAVEADGYSCYRAAHAPERMDAYTLSTDQ